MDSPLVAVAALTWLAAAYELANVIRRPSAMVTSYWLLLVFVSLAITIRTPIVSQGVDGALNLPHFSRFIANSCGVLALFATQNAIYTGLVPQRGSRFLRLAAASFAAVTLLVMAILFARSAPLASEREAWRAYADNGMAPYRLTFLTYMGISFSVAAVVWTRHALLGVGDRLRIAFLLIAAGGFMGVLYVINSVGIVLNALGDSPAAWWGDQRLTDPLLAVALVSVLLGSAVHLGYGMLDSLRKHRASLKLRPFWLESTEAYPSVTLLPRRSRLRDFLDIRDADFRLRRQVTEIRDAYIALQGPQEEARANGDQLSALTPSGMRDDLWSEVRELMAIAKETTTSLKARRVRSRKPEELSQESSNVSR